MSELMRAAANSHEAGSQYLSLEQEQLLAANSRLLACFYLLLNGRSSAEIVAHLRASEGTPEQIAHSTHCDHFVQAIVITQST